MVAKKTLEYRTKWRHRVKHKFTLLWHRLRRTGGRRPSRGLTSHLVRILEGQHDPGLTRWGQQLPANHAYHPLHSGTAPAIPNEHRCGEGVTPQALCAPLATARHGETSTAEYPPGFCLLSTPPGRRLRRIGLRADRGAGTVATKPAPHQLSRGKPCARN